MLESENKAVKTSVRQVLVTYERIPYNPSPHAESELVNAGTARANCAPSIDAPQGTQADNWAKTHRHQTVLQQHVGYFDSDKDGVIWPLDTFRGFRSLGFNLLISILAIFLIHSNFSYPTSPGVLPDPFFRVYVENIHKAKHGSDSGTYDNEGRFIPQKFEDIFSKYAGDKEGLTKSDIWNLLKGQRVIMDPIGSFGAFFEWLSLYLMLWPEDGMVKKEDIRRVYDGSLFPEISARRFGKKKAA